MKLEFDTFQLELIFTVKQLICSFKMQSLEHLSKFKRILCQMYRDDNLIVLCYKSHWEKKMQFSIRLFCARFVSVRRIAKNDFHRKMWKWPMESINAMSQTCSADTRIDRTNREWRQNSQRIRFHLNWMKNWTHSLQFWTIKQTTPKVALNIIQWKCPILNVVDAFLVHGTDGWFLVLVHGIDLHLVL